MHFGTYSFYNRAAGRYLSYQDRTLTLQNRPTAWDLQSAGTGDMRVIAHSTELMLDIHNAWVTEGNTVKLWEDTGYNVQIWTVEANANGSFSFLHSADKRYCLGFRGENAQLQLRRVNDPMQEFEAADMSGTVTWEFIRIFSKNGVVELQMPSDIIRVVSENRLQLMADRLEIAYGKFAELTAHTPFRDIIVEAYRPGEYLGWVFPGSNIIHIQRDFVYEDMAKLQSRPDDWNFCALHEMGHMFDFDKPWNFEPVLRRIGKSLQECILLRYGYCQCLSGAGGGLLLYL